MYPTLSIWGIKFYSYAVLMGAAWAIGFKTFNYFEKSKKFLALTIIFLSAWIGSKLLFILNLKHYTSESLILNSNIWLGGGFVFYGGLIAALASIFILFKLNLINLKSIHNMVPALLFSHAVGRIGCLLAGCCFGIQSNSFLSIHLHHADRAPVQLYESLALLVGGFFSIKVSNKISFYLIFYSIVRFLLEFLRGDTLRGEIFNFSTSQMLSVPILILGILTIKRFQPQYSRRLQS